MPITVTPSGQACGAAITGLDLTRPLDAEAVNEIRAAWLQHHVLSFPDQPMSHEDLERFTLYFGPFGDDPYFESIEGHQHIAAIQRKANEAGPLFASGFHTDWSFLEVPPAGTCLLGITIPPQGGDTLFANQHLAYEQMPDSLRERVQDLVAIHSAEYAYAPDGVFGEADQQAGRSMAIRPSEEARKKQRHPVVRKHPETGRPALYSTFGYIQDFVGMEKKEGHTLLAELHEYQGQAQFTYRHKWQVAMLVMWDNRSLLHKATGGFEGQDRLLYRTTIAERT